MDFKALFFLVSVFISGIIILNVLNIGANWLSVFFGIDYWFVMIGLFVLLFGGSVVFGFVLLPGGNWVWSQEHKYTKLKDDDE
jgi:hypothetical protein